MNKVWIKYTKKVQGHPSYHYVFFDEELVSDEDKANEQCLYWAESTPGGQRYGFEYEWERIDHPPIEWFERQHNIAEKKAMEAQEYQSMLTKEIIKIKHG
jgi:hypothetical protein